MTRRYRFACMVVEGIGNKMRTVEVATKQTPFTAERFLTEYRQEHGIGPKRTGVFDRKRSRWHRMPDVLA